MLIPSKFNGYVGGRRTCHTGMEPLLLSAAIGGGSAALRGDDPLKGALFGAVTGGIGSGIAGALGAAGAGAGAAGAAAPIVEGVGMNAAAQAAAPSMLGDAASQGIMSGLPQSFMPAVETASAMPINMGSVSSMPLDAAGNVVSGATYPGFDPSAYSGASQMAAAPSQMAAASPITAAPPMPGLSPEQSLFSDPSLMGGQARPFSAAAQASQPASQKGLMELWKNLPPEKKLLYGGAGGLGLMALMGQRGNVPGQAPYTGPLSRFRYNPDTYQPSRIPSRFTGGGIASLGSYSDGGRLLKGPGDGMSDNIPATISNKRPARLADGEFVVPADVVSHLGNGSTDAGAKQLYAMMDKVRKARTGRKAQGKQIRAAKFMPA